MPFVERLNLGFLSELLPSEKKVLESLLNWEYTLKVAHYRNIAIDIKIGSSTVARALLILRERGIISKNNKGSYFIKPKIKEQLLIELAPKEEEKLPKEEETVKPQDLK